MEMKKNNMTLEENDTMLNGGNCIHAVTTTKKAITTTSIQTTNERNRKIRDDENKQASSDIVLQLADNRLKNPKNNVTESEENNKNNVQRNDTSQENSSGCREYSSVFYCPITKE